MGLIVIYAMYMLITKKPSKDAWFCRGDRTRTCDSLVPNQERYQLRYAPFAEFISCLLAYENSANSSDFSGAYGTRTRDLLRDRQAF